LLPASRERERSDLGSAQARARPAAVLFRENAMISTELARRLQELGQQHLLAQLERLDAGSARRLSAQIASLDLELLAHFRSLLTKEPTAPKSEIVAPELFPLDRDARMEARAKEASEAGDELLNSGRVAYLVVAGGQASRLGYSGPKGTFPVGPVSGCSLFELHAKRLRAAARRYSRGAPWCVMTSPANDAATRDYFLRHAHFGLPPEDVLFFVQDVAPALDAEGRLILSGPDELFFAPNGHGGALFALKLSGVLDQLRGRGIRQVSYFQVDNPLARPADPVFLGLHELAGAGMSSKVVAKRSADERVGVVARIDGRMGCIEYSDLPERWRRATDSSGRLLLRAGNIAVHALDTSFLERLLANDAFSLPWHLARKQMQVYEEGGLHPREGVKFESFVFDALGASERSVTMEVNRAQEFSPIKNAQGQDSPETARAALCSLYASWVESAGLPLPEPDQHGIYPVEVDPGLAEHAGEFLALRSVRPRVSARGHLYG
jgi:UDP-N-acetylglucosamine/UDP-N-acetylgalactosamine diphosphorylase